MKGNALLDRVSRVSRTFTAALNSSLVHSATEIRNESVSQEETLLSLIKYTLSMRVSGAYPVVRMDWVACVRFVRTARKKLCKLANVTSSRFTER